MFSCNPRCQDCRRKRIGQPFGTTVASRYGAAVVMVCLALALRLAIAPINDQIPYVTFFPAGTLAALFGGFGPGMFATALCTILVHVLLLPLPSAENNYTPLLSTLVYLADMTVVCLVVEAMHKHQRKQRALIVELTDASLAKERFFAAASHDLRQPFQTMTLFVDTLRRAKGMDTVRQVVSGLDACLTSGNHLLEDFLAISTLGSSGGATNRPVPINMVEFLRSLETRFAPLAVDKGLRFRVRCFVPAVEADPTLLARIADNLVSNAVHYTAHGGILVSCRKRQGRVVIDVFDTGIGIPEENLDEIFVEFVRLNDGRALVRSGTGLGLSIAKRCADKMRGELTVRSVAGRGSRFSLALPTETEPTASTSWRAFRLLT